MKTLPTLAFCLLAPTLAWAADHVLPPVKAATAYPAVEIHADEQIAIAADPYDTGDKAKLFRVDYLKYGILPVLLVVTNQSDRPISLRDARIVFVTADGEHIQAAEPEDLLRRISPKFSVRNGMPVPRYPIPIPSVGAAKPKSSNKQIQEDLDTFEFGALTVEAHTTRTGFLFYDIADLDQPLRGAKLLLRKLRNADGAELFYFEVPFDLYLRSKTAHMQ